MKWWKASLLAAVLVAGAGAGVGIAIGGKKEVRTVTHTQIVRTPAAPAQAAAPTTSSPSGTTPGVGGGSSTPGVGADTLADFQTRNAITGSNTSVTAVNISGKGYPEGLSTTIYGDSVGDGDFTLITQRRYTTVSGIVGIDSLTDCPSNAARVSIRDQSNRTLWGPVKVSITKPVRFKGIPISDVIQLQFLSRVDSVQDPSASDCGNGHAQPAWADFQVARK